MSVVERWGWECEGCGTLNADPLLLSHSKLNGNGARCHGPVVRVDYVPAEQLRGAVGALRALFDATAAVAVEPDVPAIAAARRQAASILGGREEGSPRTEKNGADHGR